MTPIRVGDSWARTSLPPRPSAATVAAEFRRSDLRDVIVFMDPPCELCDRWSRCRSVSSSIWITLFEVNAPVTSGDRELTDPSKIGCTCERRNPAAFLPQAAVRPPDMAPHSEAGPASADKSVEPAPSTAPQRLVAQPEATHSEGGLAYCVRLCDGRYFPIQRHSGVTSAQTCSSNVSGKRNQDLQRQRYRPRGRARRQALLGACHRVHVPQEDRPRLHLQRQGRLRPCQHSRC